MRFHPALPLCGLVFGLIGASAMAAGLDPNAVIGIESQWRSEAPKKPIIPQPAPPRPARKYLTQAQAPADAPRDDASPANPLEAAVKAEMDKRWGEAERLYREAIAKEPDRVDLILHLSDVLAVQGKRLDAAQTLAKAADLRPDDSELQLHASEAYGAADRPAEAARYNDRALALRPNEQSLLQRRADLAIWLGDNARAAETLKRLSETNPNDLKLQRDLAKVLGWQGRWDEAAKVLAGYAAEHPEERDALLDLARVQSAAGDTDAAQASLRRYLAAGGRDDIYRAEVAKIVSDISAPILAEMEKRYADAERMYREMLALQPDRTDVLPRLADVLATEGKRLEAAETMAKAADLKPNDADLQLRASEAFGAAGRLDGATRYAERAMALRPADPGLQRRRAELYIWAGKYADAEKILRALIAADPADLSLKPDLARVLAARGRSRESAELLQRYREAGGKEAVLPREPGRARPAVQRPAKAAPAPGAPSNIPAAVIRAEGAKRWAEAVRLLRGQLAREPGRVDLWLRLVDNLAVQNNRLEAAEAMARAADLKPQDADLQVRASQAYGAADRPRDALRYVNRALALRPSDLEYHRRRAEVATWGGENAQAEQSLRVLIAADLADLKLRLDLGRVVGWQDRLEEAADILSDYVARRPDEKEGLLALSRVQAGRGNFGSAVNLLGRYAASGGDGLTYQRDLALDLAWAGRIYTPLAVTDTLLASDPGDFQAHFARSVALLNGYAYEAAVAEADNMARLRPDAAELYGLRRGIETPMRSYMRFDIGARWGSDNVSGQAADLSYYHRLNDVWWVFGGGTGDLVQALRGSAFAPIGGGTTMGRGGGYVGAQARLALGTIGSARIGATGTNGTTEPTWAVSIDSRVSDELRVQLSNTRDLQTLTPRSLSLDVTHVDTAAQFTYTPDLDWTVVAIAQEGEFSDHNRLWRAFMSPRRAVLRTQYLNVDLGVSGNWYGYSRNVLLRDGYYSPSLYQHYYASGYLYYKMSDEDGISLIASYGMNKDETMPNFKFTQDYSAEATFGMLSDWMLKIRGAYTTHGSLGPNFSAESVGMTLVRRF